MSDFSQEDTQPVRTRSGAKQEPPSSQPSQQVKVSPKSRLWRWILSIFLVIFIGVILGSLAGYQSARRVVLIEQDYRDQLALDEQFELGIQDLAAGRYEVARQRFEFILRENPSYPGAAEKLAEAMAVLYATSTPSPIPPTITPTPTLDPRPIEELIQHAQSLFNSQDWNGTIDTLLAARKADPLYQVTEVDRLLYLSLRNRGIQKILNLGNLAGGIYDLALAASFGPLDIEALNTREWARLYLVGLSFWEVHPEQAVYYFNQVAAAAPGLRDLDGWTASERYRVALIQYGDLLAGKNDWCAAQEQYELSLSIRADAAVEEKWKNAALQCSPPTQTITSTSDTATPTPTWAPNITPSSTSPVVPTASYTVAPASPTATSPLPLPTDTQPPPIPSPTSTTSPYPSPGLIISPWLLIQTSVLVFLTITLIVVSL